MLLQFSSILSKTGFFSNMTIFLPFIIFLSAFVWGGEPAGPEFDLIQQNSARESVTLDSVNETDFSVTSTYNTDPSEKHEDKGDFGYPETTQSEKASEGEPTTEKVSAYNNSSGDEMPTEIPQGAIDNSPSLENSPTPTNEPNPIPTIPTLTPSPREIHPRIVIPPPMDEPPVDRGCGCGQSDGKMEQPCVCIH